MNYMITASCDPYHAPSHYINQQVLQRDGQTPIIWIYADRLTYSTARKEIEALLDEVDYLHFEDDSSIADQRQQMIDDGMTESEINDELNYYCGQGYYDSSTVDNECIWNESICQVQLDTVTYTIVRM